MTFRQHLRENLTLAVPVMFANLGHVMMGVADSVMVGHINAKSLAAAGLANVIFNVLFLFGIGVSYGITPFIAKASGEGDSSSAAETLRHGLIINVINGCLLAGTVVLASGLLYSIGQPEEVVVLALPYLKIIAWSLLPVLIFQTYRQFAEGLGKTFVAMVIVLITNIVNIVLNYILINGKVGFPELGLEGAGWATLISRIIMAVSIMVYVFHARIFLMYRSAFRIAGYSFAKLRSILKIGLPTGVQYIFEVAAFDFSLVMMGWISIQAQAAHQIAINLATVSYMVTAGLASAATVRTGYFLGSQDYINLRKANYSILTLALGLMFCFAVFFMAMRNILPQFYVEDTGVYPLAASLLVIAGLFQLSDGTQVVCAAALRGFQDVVVPTVFILFAYWVIGLPIGYWLAFKTTLGPMGIWIGLLTGLTLTATAMLIRLIRKLKKLNLSSGEL